MILEVVLLFCLITRGNDAPPPNIEHGTKSCQCAHTNLTCGPDTCGTNIIPCGVNINKFDITSISWTFMNISGAEEMVFNGGPHIANRDFWWIDYTNGSLHIKHCGLPTVGVYTCTVTHGLDYGHDETCTDCQHFVTMAGITCNDMSGSPASVPTAMTPASGPARCQPSPCMNGGTCHDNFISYTCSCPKYITDLHREEIVVGGCVYQRKLCLHSFNFESYWCSCPTNFTGFHCETIVADKYPSKPCLTGVCEQPSRWGYIVAIFVLLLVIFALAAYIKCMSITQHQYQEVEQNAK